MRFAQRSPVGALSHGQTEEIEFRAQEMSCWSPLMAT